MFNLSYFISIPEYFFNIWLWYMFNNDERYWDIGLLNKWFAISSIIFLAVTIWVFVDDNDDEFKDYQREFRKMEVEIAKKS